MRTLATCPNCQKGFRAWHYVDHIQVCCSRRCAAQYRTRNKQTKSGMSLEGAKKIIRALKNHGYFTPSIIKEALRRSSDA